MTNKPAVLVVDDDRDVADDIADILEETGKYHVFKAYSGAEAIKLVREKNGRFFSREKIKLMMLDIRMPELDGIETLKKVQSIDEEIRAIMVTAYNTDEYQIDSIFVGGAVAYILKPYKRDDLINKLELFFKGLGKVMRTQAMHDYLGPPAR